MPIATARSHCQRHSLWPKLRDVHIGQHLQQDGRSQHAMHRAGTPKCYPHQGTVLTAGLTTRIHLPRLIIGVQCRLYLLPRDFSRGDEQVRQRYPRQNSLTESYRVRNFGHHYGHYSIGYIVTFSSLMSTLSHKKVYLTDQPLREANLGDFIKSLSLLHTSCCEAIRRHKTHCLSSLTPLIVNHIRRNLIQADILCSPQPTARSGSFLRRA